MADKGWSVWSAWAVDRDIRTLGTEEALDCTRELYTIAIKIMAANRSSESPWHWYFGSMYDGVGYSIPSFILITHRVIFFIHSKILAMGKLETELGVTVKTHACRCVCSVYVASIMF